MAQSSGPISQGTTAERQFSDVLWRDLFGAEPGVLGDMNGTSYALTLPAGTDAVTVGSASQASLATVAGFVHKIAQGATESLTIPAASGSTRTDIIALRYDPAYTGLPGPVRLFRIAGSSASVPAYDSSPGGIEELPLWSITRAVGQNLSAATVTRMFPRIAPQLDLPTGAPLPTNSPLGTVVRQGNTQYRRVLDNTSTPVWSSVAGDEKHGGGNVTTNGTGNFTVTHNLGVVPTFVGVHSRLAGAVGGHEFGITGATSTTFTCRAYYNNVPHTSDTFAIYWEVKA